MTTDYEITIKDTDEVELFKLTVPAFDITAGASAILSAISELPPTSKPKRVRSDKGKARKKVEAQP